jgi:hypothetical protein
VTTPAVEAFWGGYPGYFRDLDGYLWEVVWHPGFPLDAKGVVALPVWRMSDPSSDNPIVILGLLRRRSTEKKKIELTREILLPGRVGGDLSFWRTGRLFSTILKMRRTGTVIGIARSKSRCRNPEAGFGTERPRRIVSGSFHLFENEIGNEENRNGLSGGGSNVPEGPVWVTIIPSWATESRR